MSIDRRQANQDWYVLNETGHQYLGDYGASQLAVLMDIRGELQRLNTLLHCSNFVGIPQTLRKIDRNTARKPRKKAKR